MLTPGAYDARFMRPATLCRCGHILECCADCRGWLVENSPRIADGWRWRMTGHMRFFGAFADSAEAEAIAAYELSR